MESGERRTEPRDDTMAPKLSVTVLNYNYARYLDTCLDSILGQTMRDFEVILINDSSTDNSLEVIKPYLHDSRIRLIDHIKNKGFVDSLVEGVELSRGRYISVISADDYALDATAFERACWQLDSDANIAMFYSAWQEVDGAGRGGYVKRAAMNDFVVAGVAALREFLMNSTVMHSGTVIRKTAYDAVGGYDLRFRYAVDTTIWLKLCSVGKVAYCDVPLYAYRIHGSNMSNSSDALWHATEEWLEGMDSALARFSTKELPDKENVRLRGLKSILLAVPTHDIFNGRFRRGWSGYWQAFRHYPLPTLGQKRTITLVLRTVLGARGFAWLQRATPLRGIKTAFKEAKQNV